MAIHVGTSDPSNLINKIRELIDSKSISTWSYDQDGDFTYEVEQWKNRAWVHASSEEGRVVFSVLCRKDKNMSVIEYAVYHGRFVEMLLTHLDQQCINIEVTPLASKYDIINASEK